MDEIGDNDLASIANCDRTIRVLAKGDANDWIWRELGKRNQTIYQ